MKNRIYFFTGTGNSLKAAKDIAANLPETERIGFVFPIYCWGLPLMVEKFIKDSHFPKQGDTYFFVVATFGGVAGAALGQARDILLEKGVNLNYGAKIKMFANALFCYNMSKNIEKTTEKSNKRIETLIPNIVNMETNRIPPTNKFWFNIYKKSIDKIHEFSDDFNLNGDCNSCGICRDCCPAKNITINNGRPEFQSRCEACVSCIQHCPKKAINYAQKTQNRRRYAHPQITCEEISQFFKS